MKKYKVTITFNNNRKNSLIEWADNAKQAEMLALKWWGKPTIYKELIVEEIEI